MTANKDNNPRPGEYLATFAFLAAILLMFILGGCAPSRIAERTRYQRDTTYLTIDRVDSVFVKDSIYIREKNDTVLQYVERIRERYRLVHDTTFIHRTDTVQCEHIVETKVVRPLTGWQTFSITFGRLCMAALGVFIAIALLKKRR